MTLIIDAPTKPRVKRWTKSEYLDLVERGAFRKQRVFLHRGELIEAPPMGALHAFGISNIDDWFHDTFRPQFRLRIQMPFDAVGESTPEPDCVVVTHEQMGRLPHPNQAELLIEVSDSSIEKDHDLALDYAASHVLDYWILNVRDRQLEVYRDPIADPGSPTGFRYESHRVFVEGESVSPLARPDASVTVAALLKTT